MKQHFVVPPTEDSLQTFGVGTIIGGKFRLEEKIGQGSFGMIFKCISSGETSEVFAIKLEKRNQRHSSMLVREIKVMMEMKNDRGFAKMQTYGKDEDFNYIVMSYLGRNIDSLLKKCSGCFSMQTTINVAEQMITRLEALHNKNLIHRDIKPENYVIGYGSNFTVVHLIDFGLAKYYMDSQGNHIPFIEKKGMIGTARYASINAHLGNEQSRRDDMEALGYLLLYLAKGKLPWQNINADTKDEKYEKIKVMKMQLSIEQLCEGLPTEFNMYFKHVKSLKFEETPNYSMLRKFFSKIAVDRKIEHLIGTLDWESLPDYRQRKKYQTVAPYVQKNSSVQQLELPHKKQDKNSSHHSPNNMMINSATVLGSQSPQKQPTQQQSPDKQVMKSNLGSMLGKVGQFKIDQQHLLKLEHSVNLNDFQNVVISNGTSNTLQTGTLHNQLTQRILKTTSVEHQMQQSQHQQHSSNQQQQHQNQQQYQQSTQHQQQQQHQHQQQQQYHQQQQQQQHQTMLQSQKQLQLPNNNINNNGKNRQEDSSSQNPSSQQYLNVPNNEKASNSHDAMNSSGGAGTSKLNNYMWSESDDVTNEESIKVNEVITKDMHSLNNPQAIIQEIRTKSIQLRSASFLESQNHSEVTLTDNKLTSLQQKQQLHLRSFSQFENANSLQPPMMTNVICENINDVNPPESHRDIKIFHVKKAFTMTTQKS